VLALAFCRRWPCWLGSGSGTASPALVPIEPREVGGELIQTVDARELWLFLEVGRQFQTWLDNRIEQYGFKAGADFFPVSGSIPQGRGQPQKNYALTLDMAKELSMVERNARGKQARQYFIDCERQAKEAAKPKALALDDPMALRQGRMICAAHLLTHLHLNETAISPLWPRSPRIRGQAGRSVGSHRQGARAAAGASVPWSWSWSGNTAGRQRRGTLSASHALGSLDPVAGQRAGTLSPPEGGSRTTRQAS
jgi:phage anti-repressor protein